MTYAATSIAKSGARCRKELPIIACGVQRKLQDSIGIVILYFAVSNRVPFCPEETVTAGAGDKLPQAELGIELARGCLGSEALVVVVVCVHYHISAMLI